MCEISQHASSGPFFCASDHDDRAGGPKHRTRKGRGPFRAPVYSEQFSKSRHRGGHGGAAGTGSKGRFEESDADIAMMDDGSQDDSSQRRL